MKWDESKRPRDSRGRFALIRRFYSVSKAEYIYNTDIPSDSYPIDVEIDELVPCLRDTSTGKFVDTTVRKLNRGELTGYTKANGWYVNWSKGFGNAVEIYGVFVKGNNTPEGMVALSDNGSYMYVNFLCVAPHNNKLLLKDTKPRYTGIGGHLFAHAIRCSVRAGYNGDVIGRANCDKVLHHYVKQYGALFWGGNPNNRFALIDEAAQNILNKYNYEEE